jgi:hypothetical protein
LKQLFILFILGFFLFPAIGQVSEQDHEKYWNYRNRLRTYFLHVGEGQGASIPAGIRNFINWETGKPSILHWGDATLYLGWYLGVLSTEYHLLKTNNRETTEIAEELWYALLAVERLDSVAEKKWNKPPVVNGFLIRDDIPANFIELNPHLNYNLDDEIFYSGNSGTPVKVTEVLSDYTTHHSAFSQDQIVHLLMGLSLTVHFASEEINITKDSKQIKINPGEKARLLVDLIVHYAANTDGKSPWQMRYPDGGLIPNKRGGDLRANASGIAQINKLINGNKKDFLANFPFNSIWQLQQVMIGLRKNVSSLHMALVTAAVSNYWRGIFGENTTEKAIHFQGNYAAGNYLWITYEANKYGWNYFYNYLRTALHDEVKVSYTGVEEIIKSAPYNGPYYHLENDTPGGGWAASRRFIDTPPRQTKGSIHFPGNYNGLDFMLFFNLYHIADNNARPELYKKPIGFNFEF